MEARLTRQQRREAKAFRYIYKNRSEPDYVEDKLLYGHVNTFKSTDQDTAKDEAKRIARNLRKIWPEIDLKILKMRFRKGAKLYFIFNLYASYYDYWEVVN